MEVARTAILAGLNWPISQKPIRHMRSRIPVIVAEYSASLPTSYLEGLKEELASAGFVESDALEKCGQEVVSEISWQRQDSFRGGRDCCPAVVVE